MGVSRLLYRSAFFTIYRNIRIPVCVYGVRIRMVGLCSCVSVLYMYITGSDWGGPFGICEKFSNGSKVELGQLAINTGTNFTAEYK